MEQIINSYYENNARKLRRIVDQILSKFGGLSDKDMDDFYSLANAVFVDVMKRYDDSQPFDPFLYSCLSNKIKTEMTRRNRDKRRGDFASVSIYDPLDDENTTLEDILVSDFNLEKIFFGGREGEYSRKMQHYLSRLSHLQKEVLHYTAVGYSPDEIRKKLRITEKQYADCNAAIHAYRNISLLF